MAAHLSFLLTRPTEAGGVSPPKVRTATKFFALQDQENFIFAKGQRSRGSAPRVRRLPLILTRIRGGGYVLPRKRDRRSSPSSPWNSRASEAGREGLFKCRVGERVPQRPGPQFQLNTPPQIRFSSAGRRRKALPSSGRRFLPLRTGAKRRGHMESFERRRTPHRPCT